jgi:phosphoglycolate phosphatase
VSGEKLISGYKQAGGIIFDLDGTLIDSTEDLTTSVNFALQQTGLPCRSHEEIKGFVGDGVVKLVQRAVGIHNPDKAQQVLTAFLDHYKKHCTDSTTLYHQVGETLEQLQRDYYLAVLTNKAILFTEKILSALSIKNYFTDIIGGDSLPTKKPDPAGIHFLGHKWNLSADRMIMVGDHHTDIRAGKNSGAGTIFIEGRMGHTDGLQADATIRSFEELPETIKRLLS